MYVVVDERPCVAQSYVAAFSREGVAAQGFSRDEFRTWMAASSGPDLGAVHSFLLGDMEGRVTCPELIRSHSSAPIIALEDVKSLSQTLELFTVGIDDVVRKPVHVREIMARSDAVWRRMRAGEPVTADPDAKPQGGRLKVYFDGRDPQIDGEVLALPRRERHILEYLVKNARRRVTKAQVFSAIYGLFNTELDESVVEGHVSKLRKKLRGRLGYEVIDAKRYLGYQFLG